MTQNISALKSVGPTNDTFFCLAQLTSPWLSPEDADRMISSSLPWPALLKLAGYHGVLPVLYKNLKPVFPQLPAGIREELRRLYLLNARRMLLFTAEIHRITKAFQNRGVPCLLLKGPVLASLLCGDLTMRQSADIDIMTFPQFSQQAFEAIAELGYSENRGGMLSRRLKAWFPGLMKDLSFFQAQRRAMVDLHFRLLPAYLLSMKEEKNILYQFAEKSFCDIKVVTLADAELLLYLCLHGSVHRFDQLIWLADIAGLMSFSDEASLTALFLRAKELNLERPLIQALLLLKRFYHRPMPEFVGPYENSVAIQKTVRTAQEIMAKSGSIEASDRWARICYMQRLRKGQGYKIRCVGGLGLRQAFHALFG